MMVDLFIHKYNNTEELRIAFVKRPQQIYTFQNGRQKEPSVPIFVRKIPLLAYPYLKFMQILFLPEYVLTKLCKLDRCQAVL